jgi:sec-independent protein translocase protein TatC
MASDDASGESPEQEEIVAQPEEEEGGGPVKSFLEHLEDLRWTLIKVAVALVLGMLLCLVGGRQLVAFLTYPLRLATQLRAAKPSDTVTIRWGTNVLARFARTNFAQSWPGHDTNVSNFQIVLQPAGAEAGLKLRPDPVAPSASKEVEIVFLKNYGPLSAFMVAIKLALYGGLVLSLPFIIFFVGQFVLPALYRREREFVLRALGVGGFLFLLGLVFCYFVLLQVALTATVEFSRWLGFGADEWRAEEYISFVCMFMLVMGVSFELPIVILALVRVGLLDYEKLGKSRAYVVVGELILCAVLTPSGDPFTMLLMALPLHFLYEVSTVISWFWARKERQRAAAEAAGKS